MKKEYIQIYCLIFRIRIERNIAVEKQIKTFQSISQFGQLKIREIKIQISFQIFLNQISRISEFRLVFFWQLF